MAKKRINLIENVFKFLKKDFKFLKESFNINLKKIMYSVTLDFSFLVLISVPLVLFLNYSSKKIIELQSADLSGIVATQNIKVAEILTAKLNSLLIWSIVFGFFWAIFFIVIFSITSYLIWSVIAKNKLKLKQFFHFFLYNLIIWGFYFVIFFLFVKSNLQEPNIFIFFTPVYLILANLFYAGFFISKQKINAFFSLLKKLNLLIVPLLISILIYILVFLPILLISLTSISFISANLYFAYSVSFIFLFILLGYFFWFRNYFYLIARSILK